MGYVNAFVGVAEDCRATTGQAPPSRPWQPTVASVQYAMLSAQPGRWTQEDVLLASTLGVRGRDHIPADELARLRDEYFAQPRACLRASPLPKTYGWGLHYDGQGRITLHGVGTPGYERWAQDGSVQQLRAMRSSRPARG